MPGNGDKSQKPYGAIVVIAGLAALVAIFVAAALTYKTATEVATAISPLVGVVAALVGAYFGIRGATLAQGQAMAMMKPAGDGQDEKDIVTKKPPPPPAG